MERFGDNSLMQGEDTCPQMSSICCAPHRPISRQALLLLLLLFQAQQKVLHHLIQLHCQAPKPSLGLPGTAPGIAQLGNLAKLLVSLCCKSTMYVIALQVSRSSLSLSSCKTSFPLGTPWCNVERCLLSLLWTP